MKYHVLIKQTVTPAVTLLRLKPYDPKQRLDYLAGQYIEIESHAASFIPLSIANAPRQDGSLDFYIRHLPEDKDAVLLLEHLGKESVANIAGPFGRCVYQASPLAEAVFFLAGGTGASQVKALIEQAIANADQRPHYLYWGVREAHGCFLEIILDEWREKLHLFDYKVIFRDSGYPQQVLIEDHPDLSRAVVYSSGPWAMTDKALALFLQHGLERESLLSDRFSF